MKETLLPFYSNARVDVIYQKLGIFGSERVFQLKRFQLKCKHSSQKVQIRNLHNRQ